MISEKCSKEIGYIYLCDICLRRAKKIKQGFVFYLNIYSPNKLHKELKLFIKIENSIFPVKIVKCDENNGFRYSAQCTVKIDEIIFLKKTSQVELFSQIESSISENVTIRYYNLQSGINPINNRNGRLWFSNYFLRKKKDCAFLFQSTRNTICITCRELSPTDFLKEQFKIRAAYFLSKIIRFGKYHNCVVFFEKFASKYEESASVLYEKFISEGQKKVYFILDKKSLHYDRVPNEFQKNILPKYSFGHYCAIFQATTFVSTESMNHVVDLNIRNGLVRRKIDLTHYRYYFLQHGVMYMYALEGRRGFQKGAEGFGNNTKIVASSELEKKHFVEGGHFESGAIINAGLPKFDRAKISNNNDRILLMPTSRDFEYNIIRTTPEQSTYYKFVSNIIKAIPGELKHKLVFIPHPLIRDCFNDTELAEYIPHECIYDELLASTKLLITDYSSISYDAFYRGCHVLFCWEDKEMCLDKLGYGLMLNDNNVFADCSKSYEDLSELVLKNYYEGPKLEYVERFKTIVEHNDGKNTERVYKAIINDIEIKGKNHIRKATIFSVNALPYSGKRVEHSLLNIKYRNNILLPGKDYYPIYFGNKRLGRGHILIVGKGHFKGIKMLGFNIKKPLKDVGWKNNEIREKERILREGLDYSIVKEERIGNLTKLIIKGQGQYIGRKIIYKNQ